VTALVIVAVLAGVAALVFAGFKTSWIVQQDPGEDHMKEIASWIQSGAMAFLKKEYSVLAVMLVIVAGLLVFQNLGGVSDRHPSIALAFVVGAVTSGLAGFIGMRVATQANVRTTAAAKHGLTQALDVAFAGGSVMGMCVVGLGLVGLSLVFLTASNLFELPTALGVVTGFSMGASLIALFARVGGGIYTKAADVGADLVGKVEQDLPEDSPRNPAVIADNVGDNVGDVAGMGADLFESYVGSIVGTMVLGLGFTAAAGSNSTTTSIQTAAVLTPILLAALGILCSIGGTFLVRTKEGGNPQHALDSGSIGAAVAMAVVSAVILLIFWPAGAAYGVSGHVLEWWNLYLAMLIGLAVGVGVGLTTSYYCSIGKRPVRSIAENSKTGPATNIIAGLSVGMESTTLPLLMIAFGVVGAYEVGDLYGVALAALGMLSTTGIQLAVDAYGPIADNAGGIAEMSGQPPEVRAITDKLDAVGNTTAAIGKGFAIAAAAMTALALFAAFLQESGLATISLNNPRVMAGLFVGGMLPYLFSSLAMRAVGNAAMDMIEEVRRQFREVPGLREGTAAPDSARCVAISTGAALKQMIAPGILAVASPIVLGFLLGLEALGGFLAGVTVSGVLMAIFMSNAGGAWDNAKKSFEGEGYRDSQGQLYPKKSEAHKAAVVGDTVGDPFKDTAGPSLNILIKLISIIALIAAPTLAARSGSPTETKPSDAPAAVAAHDQPVSAS